MKRGRRMRPWSREDEGRGRGRMKEEKGGGVRRRREREKGGGIKRRRWRGAGRGTHAHTHMHVHTTEAIYLQTLELGSIFFVVALSMLEAIHVSCSLLHCTPVPLAHHLCNMGLPVWLGN